MSDRDLRRGDRNAIDHAASNAHRLARSTQVPAVRSTMSARRNERSAPPDPANIVQVDRLEGAHSSTVMIRKYSVWPEIRPEFGGCDPHTDFRERQLGLDNLAEAPI